MFSLLFDIKFIFNGITSDAMGLYNVKIDSSECKHILGGGKTLTTSRSIYSHRNVLTKTTSEPMTFSLTFTALDKPFTELRRRQIYSYFDVPDYCKMSFLPNFDFYYNVMAMTSQTELNLFSGDVGYFTIDFVCDAAHGWIDREYNFSSDYNGVFEVYNESNVRNVYGNYLVYPTMHINMAKGTYLGLCPQYKILDGYEDGWANNSTEIYNWLAFENLTSPIRFTIDNENKQIYSDSNGENLLSHVQNKEYNFIGLQEGHTYLYRKSLQGETLEFELNMKVSYPVVM